uniref:Antitoxin of type II TA system, VapB n=1 Tax=Candidatus Kentrum sp. LPFa TaxID=2126335 RepID=A0A450VLX7_9GAMM|nr:MAG: antitoxin of type II TA system, VapB [Candidatus Kentron sp. LPFa]
MQTTINIDDDLLAQANKLTAYRSTGLQDQSKLIREALHALIAREHLYRFARPDDRVSLSEAPAPSRTGKRRLGLLAGQTLRMENFEMTDEEFLRA